MCLSIFPEELKDYLLGENAINKIFTLGNSEFPVSWENEIKLWTFLETRTALLLKTYKTTIEVSWLKCQCCFQVGTHMMLVLMLQCGSNVLLPLWELETAPLGFFFSFPRLAEDSVGDPQIQSREH